MFGVTGFVILFAPPWMPTPRALSGQKGLFRQNGTFSAKMALFHEKALFPEVCTKPTSGMCYVAKMHVSTAESGWVPIFFAETKDF